jgi:hypothetical protein
MLHVPSFFIGYLSGAATVLLARRFGPAFSELAAAGYGLVDSLSATLASGIEDVEDMLAEARSRASATWATQEPPRKARVLRRAPATAAAKKSRRRSAKKSPGRRKRAS